MEDVRCDECGFDTCICEASPNNPDYALGRYDELMNVTKWLRAGGETVNGKWYAWDSEMRGYYASLADRIGNQDHLK